MKLVIALTVLMALSTMAAMACGSQKSAENTATQTSQQASTAGSQGTTQTQTRTN